MPQLSQQLLKIFQLLRFCLRRMLKRSNIFATHRDLPLRFSPGSGSVPTVSHLFSSPRSLPSPQRTFRSLFCVYRPHDLSPHNTPLRMPTTLYLMQGPGHMDPDARLEIESEGSPTIRAASWGDAARANAAHVKASPALHQRTNV
jgi:hypothetical protein